MIGNLNHGMCGFYDWIVCLTKKEDRIIPEITVMHHFFIMKRLKTGREVCTPVLLQFYHFIQPGAVRIAATCYTSFLDVTAWEIPDHSIAVIILNRSGSDLPYVLRISGKLVKYTAKASSIITAVINE